MQDTSPSGLASIFSPSGREVPLTSSTMPTVKWFCGWPAAMLSNTALTIVGLNSFEPRP